jgi:chorismate dehydratase
MGSVLRIGEYASLGTRPFFYPLKHIFRAPEWQFVAGTPAGLVEALEEGNVDIALAPPLALAQVSRDYLVFPDWGYAGRGHMRDMLLFSDLYLDDMDEMTVALPEHSPVVSSLIHVILDNYLQYQNQYIMGWGPADAYVLDGDAALRERALARYAYVYDVGDLWRHYTGRGLAYYLWMARAEAVERDPGLVAAFHHRLGEALSYAKGNWDRLGLLVKGYEWMRRNMMRKLWEQVDYELKPEHMDGLTRLFEDCVEAGLIEEVPELHFYDGGQK